MGEKTPQTFQQNKCVSLLCPSNSSVIPGMMGKSPHVLCAGNDGEGKSGSEGGSGARKDPAGRREKRLRVARGATPEHGEREGNTAHPSGARVTATPGESRGPASQGSPRKRGSLARPLLGERPSAAQGDRTKLARRPARLRSAGTRQYQDTETPGRRNSGPPHLSAAEPPLPTRGENKMATGEGKRGAQRERKRRTT